jgi:hypothetical protein
MSGTFGPLRRAAVEVELDATPAGRTSEAKPMQPLLENVTLVIYGWRSVHPGTLAWVFPSVAAALAAVKVMRNAVGWAIVQGQRALTTLNLDEERKRGAVLVEQKG